MKGFDPIPLILRCPRQKLFQPQPLLLQALPLSCKFSIIDEIPQAQAGEVVQLTHRVRKNLMPVIHFTLGLFNPFGFGLLHHAQGPVMQRSGEDDRLQEGEKLPFQFAAFNRGLAAIAARMAMGAMIVNITVPMAIGLMFGCNGQSAGSASYKAPKWEILVLGARRGGSSQQGLHALKLINRHHRRMTAHMRLSFPTDQSSIKGIGNQFIDGAQGHRIAPNSLLLSGAEPPFVACLPVELAGAGYTGEHPIPQLANHIKSIGVGDDGFGCRVYAIADRHISRSPPLEHLRAIATFNILAQVVHIIFGIAEDDRQHELALRIVFKTEIGKAEVFEDLLVEHIDNLATIDGIAGQPVGVPSNNAIGLTTFQAFEHRIKNDPARRFGTVGLLEDFHDLIVVVPQRAL